MNVKRILLVSLLTGVALAPAGALAQTKTSVTGAATGIYPPGTSFNGVPINGLRLSSGVELAADGSAKGFLHVRLVGVAALGLEQMITVEGKAAAGSRVAVNIAEFSGICSIDMGDGTAPLEGVPFSAVVTTDSNDQGSIALTLGATVLPAAMIDAGSVSIRDLD